jgi:DNA-binding NarL/FixJ family response regulator
MRRYEAYRHGKDPEALTPYEQQIWELRQQGLTNAQIGEATNQKGASVAARMKTIKEKVQLQNELQAAS